jgi:hypothetical protein
MVYKKVICWNLFISILKFTSSRANIKQYIPLSVPSCRNLHYSPNIEWTTMVPSRIHLSHGKSFFLAISFESLQSQDISRYIAVGGMFSLLLQKNAKGFVEFYISVSHCNLCIHMRCAFACQDFSSRFAVSSARKY